MDRHATDRSVRNRAAGYDKKSEKAVAVRLAGYTGGPSGWSQALVPYQCSRADSEGSGDGIAQRGPTGDLRYVVQERATTVSQLHAAPERSYG